MKKLIISVGLTLILIHLVSAQSTSYRAGNCKTKSNYCPRWSLFHETTYNFAGLGINSVNADAIVMCNRSYMASLRFGINYFTFPRISSLGAPVEFNFMIGRGAWLIEAGLGADYLYVYKNYITTGFTENNFSYLALTGRIGIRFEKLKSLFFRAGYNPHVSLVGWKNIEPISKHAFLHLLSVGIGYTFNN